MKNIREFSKGDIITRLKPIYDTESGKKDYSFVGRKLYFLGIANSSIYLSADADLFTAMLTGKNRNTLQLPEEMWGEDWGIYEEPDFLLEEDPDESFRIDDEKSLEDQINEALDRKDFQKIIDFQNRLQKKKNGGKDEDEKRKDKD